MATPTVHVWQADVSAFTEGALGLLSPEERARANRFRRAADRTRFVASHAALRQVLAAALSGFGFATDAAALQFGVGAQGKPHLLLPDAAPDVRFNLAHSGDVALIAVAVGCEVGVDVEAERPLPDALRLAERVAGPQELRALGGLSEPDRSRAFFRLWVAKEAVLKARGTGLHADPRQVRLSGLHPGPAALDHAGGSGAWSLRSLAAPPGYHAALATAARKPAVSARPWPPSPGR